MASKLQELFNDFVSIYYNKTNWVFSDSISNIDDVVVKDDFYQGTMLNTAAYNGNNDIVKRCIALGADVNKADCVNRTPLYYALLNEYRESAELLLQAGADPNVKVNFAKDQSPFLIVLFWIGDITDIKLLLKYGMLTNEMCKYRDRLIYLDYEDRVCFKKILAKRRWVYVKTAVKVLSLQKRAVITANAPERLRLLGTFELEEFQQS